MDKEQTTTCLTSRQSTQRNRIGEVSEGLSGSETVACMERNSRNLGDPDSSDRQVGKFNQSKKRKADSYQGVGLTHITLRTGKPATWGRG